MNNSIFSSLGVNDKYLLAIYTLFNADGSETGNLKDAMGKLTGKPFVDMEMAAGILKGKGLIREGAYNWRTATYDYSVRDEYLIPAMMYLYGEEKELTIAVLEAAKALRPSAVQKMLWRYISSDYRDISLFEISDYEISMRLRCFIPAVHNPDFAQLLMLFDHNNFSSLLHDTFVMMFVDEEIADTTHIRSLLSGYRFFMSGGEEREALAGICDLYDYLAYGRLPRMLLPGYMSHRIIAAMSEAYKGNIRISFEHFKKALALYNNRQSHASKKTNYFPLDIVNFFFVLISYLTGTDEGRRRALGVSKAVENDVTSAGKVLYDILYGGSTDNAVKRKLTALLSSSGRTTRALAVLMCHYLGKELSQEPQPQWLIMKHEMRAYRAIDAASESDANAAYGKEGLLASTYHKKEWENVLEDLMGQAARTVREGVRNSRIAYFMDSTSSSLVTVKVQTMLKNGSWSAGKTVSLASFYNGGLPEMTLADSRIANAARKTTYDDNWLEVKHLLPEMTEHSRLYVGSHSPYRLVEVIEEMPYITLLRTPSGFLVSSNVPADKIDDGIIIVHTGETTINFLRITEEQQPYYNRLLSLGHFPLEAEEPLRTFLRGIGGKIEVNSDLIEGGSTLPITGGQARMTMQIRPYDRNNYAVSVFVRPLEGGRIRCRPGRGEDIIMDGTDSAHYTRVRRNMAEEAANMQHFLDNTGMKSAETDATMVLDAYDLLPLVEYAQQNTDRIICEWQDGARIKVRGRSSSTVWNGAIKKTENGWFEIEGTVELDQGKVITMAQLLDLTSQGRGRFIKLGDGEFLALSEKLRQQLSRLDAIASRSHGKVQVSPFSAALLGADLLDGELSIAEDGELKQIRERIKEASTYSPDVPQTLNATLRKYQKEGYRWMSRLNRWGAGALLADDMGLGKTIQTIAFLLLKAQEGPALVVAPASVAPNWQTEFAKFAPSLNVTILNFAENRRAVVRNAQAGDVVITTYGLLLSVKEFLVNKHWTTICLDEAHIIKNRGAKTSAVAMRLTSDNRVMLTGTPVQNHLGELWNLFQFVNPGLLGSFEDFSRRFIVPIEQNGDKTRQQELNRIVKPFMLRRTKDKVAKELPEKEEIYQRVTMSEEEMLVYEVLRRKAEAMLLTEGTGRVSMNTLAEITRLRQCSCDIRLVEEGRNGGTGTTGSKITALVELLQTIIEGFITDETGKMQGGALVFSQFTSYLALIRQALDAVGIHYLYIDGSVDIKTRQNLVEKFQNGACPVFLISLKAGGLGLNLTRANYVIHTDPWWNPAIEAQATDRVHRIGQKQSVTVYHLIAEGTIEEKIQRLHERKQALVQDILDSTDMSHKLTGEELLEMVR